MDTIFLIASKLIWALIRPETLLLLLFALPYAFLRLGRIKAASRSLGLALSVALCISVFPVGNLVLNPLERAYPSHPTLDAPSGIIVLSPQGKITRYLYGLNFLPFDAKMALIEAQKGVSQPTINKILDICFAYDPGSKTYSLQITRIVGGLLLFIALSVLIILLIKGRRKSA